MPYTPYQSGYSTMHFNKDLHFKYKKYSIRVNEISFCQINIVHIFIKWKIYLVGYSSLWVVPAVISVAFAGTTAKPLGLDQLYSQNCVQRHLLQWQTVALICIRKFKFLLDFATKLSPGLWKLFSCFFCDGEEQSVVWCEFNCFCWFMGLQKKRKLRVKNLYRPETK